MSATSGTDPLVLSRPAGGGAVRGLGTSFSTDLNTGGGSYGVPIEVPAGPNGLRPKLDLSYQSAGSTGPFGLGWTLGTLAVVRSTDHGVLTYGDSDRFAIPGVGELLPLDDGTWRPEVDTLTWLVRRAGEGWEVADRDGTRYVLGATAGTRIEEVLGPSSRTSSWLLERMTDVAGNTVTYRYVADGGSLLLSRVEWGTWQVRLGYEQRPDPFLDGRTGRLVTSSSRCATIELHAPAAAQSLVRRWALGYTQGAPSGHSLLTSVTLTGHGADGEVAAAPVLRLGYTEPARATLRPVGAPAVPGGGPGSLADGTGELVDLSGDGLPDLLEVGPGGARVWDNLGQGRWAPPRRIDVVPPGLGDPGVALADLNGDATADLLVLDRPLGGYHPLVPGRGFGPAVVWRDAPAVQLAGPAGAGTARLADLDGDGTVDLLASTRDSLALWFRAPDGWSPRPVLVPAGQAPPVAIGDPRVRLADLSGDGLPDLVRVRGGRVTCWPGLGRGRWADAHEMGALPDAPAPLDPARLHLVDVDGDGRADCVYVDLDRVLVWHNLATGWSPPTVVRGTPPCPPEAVRLVDLLGTGTAGVLFSRVAHGGSGTRSVFLDLQGGRKPYLLASVDAGLGTVQRISYRTSTDYASQDRAAGRRWTTFCPMPVHCVAEVLDEDRVTGTTHLVRNRYHDGSYDPRGRVFAGFAEVEVEDVGDDVVPTMLTTNRYSVGLHPDDTLRPLTTGDRLRFGALRHRLLETARYAPDGSPSAGRPFQVVRHEHEVELLEARDGRFVALPRPARTTEEQWERGERPFAVREISYLAYDRDGNVLRQRERAFRAADPDRPDYDVTTEITFARDDVRHVVGKPVRVTESAADGSLLAVTVHAYDGPAHTGLPEGMVADGFLTRISRLAVTDELAESVYGADQPDWAAHGYLRRPGESGWWVTEVSWARSGPPEARVLESRSPVGGTTVARFDVAGQALREVVDAVGHRRTADIDPRTGAVVSVTDENGRTTRDRLDPLGRVVVTVSPGDDDVLPSVQHDYRVADLTGTRPAPARTGTRRRVRHGEAGTSDEVAHLDGRGQTLAVVGPGEGDDGRRHIVREVSIYCARGALSRRYLPRYASDDSWVPPEIDAPHVAYRYDAAGRMVEQVRPDGARVQQEHGPGFVRTVEETTLAGQRHHVVTSRLDALRRVVAVEHETGVGAQRRTDVTTYRYVARDRLAEVGHADGGTSVVVQDLLGRILAQVSGDTGRTLFILDAAGKQVERRLANGGRSRTAYDLLDRPVAAHVDDDPAPSITWRYLGPDDPAPPDGVKDRRGRLWQVVDRIGTLTFAYDAVGRIAQTRRGVEAHGGHELVTDTEYDALGREVATDLPAARPGGPRRRVSTRYGLRGLPVEAPSVVRSADYDVVGRLRRLELANGVVAQESYDELTGQPVRLQVTAPDATVLRDQRYTYDAGGLLLSVTAAHAGEQMTCTYDDFGHLEAVDYADGLHRGWSLDPSGDMRSVDGLGELTYARPDSAQVVAAGGSAYGYDEAGFLTTAPYGTLTYNGVDDLVRVDLPDDRGVEQVFDYRGQRALRRVVTPGAPDRVTVTADPHADLVDGEATIWVTFGDRRVLAVAAASSAFLHADVHGSATLFTDSAGALVARVRLDPYGVLLGIEGRNGPATAAIVPGDVRYLGQPFDVEIGLLWMGRRGFDPRLGRFLSPDRTVHGIYGIDSWNPYCYGRGNPIRFRDPTGQFSWGDFFAIVAVVVVVAVLVVAGFFTMGTTWALAGVTISASAVFFGAAVGVAAGAILGGYAASKAGGDIWKGVLVGGLLGGVSGALGGAAGSAVFLGLGGATGGASYLAFISSGAIQGAFAGAGTGAAIGYAGGRGSAEQFWTHVAKGALIGFVSGALLGGATAYLHNNPGIGINVGLSKVDPRTPAAGGLSERVTYLDSAARLGANAGGASSLRGATSLVSLGTASPGALAFHVALPAWAPQALNTVGIAATTDMLIALDKYDVYRFGDVLFMVLESFPYFIGLGLTFADAAGYLDWAKNPVRDFFAMPS
ncbi:toxin TcdB middle/N-terminal domain-containing protein [Cellulomonas cellasea]|uniref:Uncharacterized protein n=2 Tax=Cellulomonas cellasea TaxID=43670 RepID=A0A0A0B986_9CELL|nr:toxin TcdB middle/N-terminal domain-containing protein [Cellulomonas cellasea]KGM03415.1 hypothetical protein Q760_04055 [Cellulomonas cellasea DSM 20118]GEA90250.1 hypothetical protein CCE01nite_41990 [Cellulomonas cellasea]